MKTMTCRQLGGPCDLEHHGENANEVTDERTLKKSPGMLPLFARAGVAMLPGVSRLPLLGGERGEDVPDTTLTLDKHLPVKKDRRRPFIFFLSMAVLVGLTVAGILYTNTSRQPLACRPQ